MQRASHALLARAGVALTTAVAMRSAASALHTAATATSSTTRTRRTAAAAAATNVGSYNVMAWQQRNMSVLGVHATLPCYSSRRAGWLSRVFSFGKQEQQPQQQQAAAAGCGSDAGAATTTAMTGGDEASRAAALSPQRRRRLSPRARIAAFLRATLLRMHALQEREIDAVVHETHAVLSTMRAKLHAMMAKLHAAELRRRHKLPFFARTHILDGSDTHGLPSSSSSPTPPPPQQQQQTATTSDAEQHNSKK